MGAARGAARRPRRPRRDPGRPRRLASANAVRSGYARQGVRSRSRSAPARRTPSRRFWPKRASAGSSAAATWPGSSGSSGGRWLRSSRSSATGRPPRARRSSAAWGRAASPSIPPTASTGSPPTRSTRRRSIGSTGSRAATTASPRRSSTSRRWRCESSSPTSARAPATRSGPCCPGPVTLVLDNPRHRYPLACREDPARLGVRLLDGPLAGVMHPMFQTSANISGEPAPSRFEELPEAVVAGADLAIDGGALTGLPSTVVDIASIDVDGTWTILREGGCPPSGSRRRSARSALSSAGGRGGRGGGRSGPSGCRARLPRRGGSAGRPASRRRSSRAGR